MEARLTRSRYLGFALFVAVSNAAASEIVLTAFEPFGGIPVNNSALVIDALAKRLRRTGERPVSVKECILPVEYDRGAQFALECIDGRKPDLVLSFGAGDCTLRYETRARNRDDTPAADNAGRVRDRNAPIVPGGPEFLNFNAPMVALYQKAPRSSKFTSRQSSDAGTYVCNNTAYWLAREFGGGGSKTRFGFIHVPPTTCGRPTSDPYELSYAIDRGLRAAMPELF